MKLQKYDILVKYKADYKQLTNYLQFLNLNRNTLSLQ
jgi:hypothetical protein